jgi:hypothetical protein
VVRLPVPLIRPVKRPKTGVYSLRKRVPDDLRERVGKREEKRSLKTKDAAEAKLSLLQALSELEMRWANLREGPRSLSEREAHEIAQEQLVDDWARERNPSKKTLYEWLRVIKELQHYLGHDDAARIASTYLNGWKSKLLNEGRPPKTIRSAKIAPVRAILQLGVDNDRYLPMPRRGSHSMQR